MCSEAAWAAAFAVSAHIRPARLPTQKWTPARVLQVQAWSAADNWPAPDPYLCRPGHAMHACLACQSQACGWALGAPRCTAAASWRGLGALAVRTNSRKNHCAELPARRADADADVSEGWRRNLRLRRGSELACSGRARGARKRPHLLELFGEPAPAETVIDALPVDLLVHVFCLLDQRALRFVLPLVCRHWCAAPLQTPQMGCSQPGSPASRLCFMKRVSAR